MKKYTVNPQIPLYNSYRERPLKDIPVYRWRAMRAMELAIAQLGPLTIAELSLVISTCHALGTDLGADLGAALPRKRANYFKRRGWLVPV